MKSPRACAHAPVGEAEPPPRAAGPRLRILALTLKPEGVSPGQRFRLEQWAPHLSADHGIDLHFLPFESPQLSALLYQRGKTALKAFWVLRDFLRRAKAVLSARHYDAVIVYREAALIGPALYERLLARSGVPLFFDFDDAIWEDQLSPVNGLFSRLHFWGKTASTCRLATGVIAGNPYLAAYARRHSASVSVVPTSIDLDDYPVIAEPDAGEPFTVCWTGSTTTLPLLELARPALERIAAQRPLRVKVICNRPPETAIAGADNVFLPWQAEGEAREVAGCHVGIMPLPDNSYMSGKCALKALQFMATGRPVVLSPVGMNKDLIQSGENGFLASREDEWVECLTGLADSPALRARIGLAGRRTVERDYAASVAARIFNDAVRRSAAAAASPDRFPQWRANNPQRCAAG